MTGTGINQLGGFPPTSNVDGKEKDAKDIKNAHSQQIMATMQDDDERLLAQIGYKQVSQKLRGPWLMSAGIEASL